MGNVVIQNFPMIVQDLFRRCIATRRESVSTYPRRPKAEAFSNAVDVVERLCDPTDPSTERTTAPRSAHVQLDDVPRSLDLVEDEGEFRQHVVVLPELIYYFAPLAGSRRRGRHRAERVLNAEVLYVRYLIGTDREGVRLDQPR